MGSRNLSKKTTLSFLVAALIVWKTNFGSYVSPTHLFFQFIFENHSRFCRKEENISKRSRTSIFHLALVFASIRFTRKKCKRKRKEMKNFPFLASALVLAFAIAS